MRENLNERLNKKNEKKKIIIITSSDINNDNNNITKNHIDDNIIDNKNNINEIIELKKRSRSFSIFSLNVYEII